MSGGRVAVGHPVDVASGEFFTFATDLVLGGTYMPTSSCFVANVPLGLVSSDTLLHELYERLTLPGYFGFNWNALYDCLTDLHWVAERDVVLLHLDVPALPDDELRVYLSLLDDAAASWKPEEAHSFRAVFPAACEERLAELRRVVAGGR